MALCLTKLRHLQPLSNSIPRLVPARLLYSRRPWIAAPAIRVESQIFVEILGTTSCCRHTKYSSFSPHHLHCGSENKVIIGPHYDVSSTINHCRSIHTSIGHLSESQDSNRTAAVEEVSLGTKILKTIGWLGGFYSKKSVLTRSAKTMYDSCIDNIEYGEFFKVFSLPDTFQSWFLVAHLHVWLCMVRMKREGKDGQTVIRELVANFWEDVERRLRELGVHSTSVRSKGLKELTQEFYGLTFAYEEGLLSNDKTLAAAIWRNFIHDKASTDPTQLAIMVDYIRRQVQHMDGLNTENLLQAGRVTLLPLTNTSTT